MPSKKPLPQVQPKVPLDGPLAKILALVEGYLAAQQQADLGNQLAPQVATLTTARTNLTALFAKRAVVKAESDMVEAEIAAAIGALKVATLDYGRAAARLAGTDPLLLSALGVDKAKTRTPQSVSSVVGAPTDLVILAGAIDGEARFKCQKDPFAGAYVFAYKLEPSLPADPWIVIETKHPSAAVPDLDPGQTLRARVRAIGSVTGPWSAEVIGRAK